jgi:hypothetical protein
VRLFTVEGVFLRRYYALFFMVHASRRVLLAGTKNPTGDWVTQQRETSSSVAASAARVSAATT